MRPGGAGDPTPPTGVRPPKANARLGSLFRRATCTQSSPSQDAAAAATAAAAADGAAAPAPDKFGVQFCPEANPENSSPSFGRSRPSLATVAAAAARPSLANILREYQTTSSTGSGSIVSGGTAKMNPMLRAAQKLLARPVEGGEGR